MIGWGLRLDVMCEVKAGLECCGYTVWPAIYIHNWIGGWQQSGQRKERLRTRVRFCDCPFLLGCTIPTVGFWFGARVSPHCLLPLFGDFLSTVVVTGDSSLSSQLLKLIILLLEWRHGVSWHWFSTRVHAQRLTINSNLNIFPLFPSSRYPTIWPTHPSFL